MTPKYALLKSSLNDPFAIDLKPSGTYNLVTEHTRLFLLWLGFGVSLINSMFISRRAIIR